MQKLLVDRKQHMAGGTKVSERTFRWRWGVSLAISFALGFMYGSISKSFGAFDLEVAPSPVSPRAPLPDPHRNLAIPLFDQLSKSKKIVGVGKQDIVKLCRLANTDQAKFTRECQEVLDIDIEPLRKLYIAAINKLIEVFQDGEIQRKLSMVHLPEDIDRIVGQIDNKHAACFVKEICFTFFTEPLVMQVNRYPCRIKGPGELEQSMVDTMRGFGSVTAKRLPYPSHELSEYFGKRVQGLVGWHARCEAAPASSDPFDSCTAGDEQLIRAVQFYVLAYLIYALAYLADECA